MSNMVSVFLSYTLAAMAGICFISGISLLTDRGEK